MIAGAGKLPGQLDDLADKCHCPVARAADAACQRQAVLDPAAPVPTAASFKLCESSNRRNWAGFTSIADGGNSSIASNPNSAAV